MVTAPLTSTLHIEGYSREKKTYFNLTPRLTCWALKLYLSKGRWTDSIISSLIFVYMHTYLSPTLTANCTGLTLSSQHTLLFPAFMWLSSPCEPCQFVRVLLAAFVVIEDVVHLYIRSVWFWCLLLQLGKLKNKSIENEFSDSEMGCCLISLFHQSLINPHKNFCTCAQVLRMGKSSIM